MKCGHDQQSMFLAAHVPSSHLMMINIMLSIELFILKCVCYIDARRERLKVESNYRGKGKRFSTQYRGDHTFDIAYDKDESQRRINELLIRLIDRSRDGRGSRESRLDDDLSSWRKRIA